MPNDLDQLAQDTDHQDRWRTPRWSNDLQSLAGQQQMTHQQAGPNPAQPYLDWLRGATRRTLVDPLRAAGFIPGGPNWGRGAVTGMQDFNQSGLTGVNPSLRNVMPGMANTLGDLVQSRAARDALSTANTGGLPLIEAFWSPRDLGILRKIYSADIDPYTLSGLIQRYLPGRSPVSVRQKAFQLGLKRPEIPPYVRQPGSPSVANDPQRVAQIDKMIKKGMTFDQMAMEMGDVSTRTLRRYINENLKTRLLKKNDPSANIPSMPQFNFPKGEVTTGDPEYERALMQYLQQRTAQ